MVNTLEKRYKQYQEAASAARKRSTIVDNFLGTGNAANRHPCHEEFYEDVLKLVADYVATQPSSADAAAVVDFLLTEPHKYLDYDCYWFMYVMVGCVRDLIPYLDKETCAVMAEKLNTLYPKKKRMPVQEDAYKKLKKAAK